MSTAEAVERRSKLRLTGKRLLERVLEAVNHDVCEGVFAAP